MKPESEGPKIRMTYSDGESIGSVDASAAQPGPEVVFNALDELARSVTNAVGARTDSDPEYQAAVAERDATPWYRFMRRKKLAELAMQLHTEAFLRNVGHMADPIEILNVENRPPSKSIEDKS